MHMVALLIVTILPFMIGMELIRHYIVRPTAKTLMPETPRALDIKSRQFRNIYEHIVGIVEDIRSEGNGCPDIDLTPVDQILISAHAIALKASTIVDTLAQLPAPSNYDVRILVTQHHKPSYIDGYDFENDTWKDNVINRLAFPDGRKLFKHFFPYCADELKVLNDSAADLNKIMEGLTATHKEVTQTAHKYKRFIEVATPNEVTDWRESLAAINHETQALNEALTSTEER